MPQDEEASAVVVPNLEKFSNTDLRAGLSLLYASVSTYKNKTVNYHLCMIQFTFYFVLVVWFELNFDLSLHLHLLLNPCNADWLLLHCSGGPV